MKRGFTLIELLAVIVILAIIALIATPIVLNIIEDTKNSSLEISSNMYKKALETEISKIMMTKKVEDGSYIIDSNGNIKRGNKEIKVNIDNYDFDAGVVVIESGQIKSMSLKSNNELIIDDKIQSFDIWDGTIKEVIPDTHGNYHIKKASELAWVASEVNNGNTFSEITIYLENHLDLNNKEWIPIGTETKPFNGTFEGNNNIIKNLKITRENINVTSNYYLGLFGFINNAKVMNINIYNGYIIGYRVLGTAIGRSENSNVENIKVYDSKIDGSVILGGVLGYFKTSEANNINSYNNIIMCHDYVSGGSIGYLETSNLSNSYSNSTIHIIDSEREDSQIGGVIGYIGKNVNVSNLFSEANVKGTNRVGGVVGQFQTNSTIDNTDSYATVEGSNKVGGVIGVDSGIVATVVSNINSYATVKGNDEVGGVVGIVDGGYVTRTYKNIYSKSNVIGNNFVSGIIGNLSVTSNNSLPFYYKNLVSESNINGKFDGESLYGNTPSNLQMIPMTE